MSANLSRAELLEMALSSEAEKTTPEAAGGASGTEASIVPSQPEPVRRYEDARRPDGASDIHSFLEHRSRQWSAMLRLQEQQRIQVSALEAERDTEYKRLDVAVEAVQKAIRGLRTAVELNKEGRNVAEVERAMELNRAALDQLETVAANLNTNFLAWRSAWQQYTQSLEASRRIRADMDAKLMTRG